ncbi:MAG: DUF3040 domain-containing protein [Propioniciclava sp.]|uniref:DUF3040 domain-containing protein n=1 Tax=Propioniciclava sp. TaxID=2038686 RepID=UPI0039E5EBC5
MALSEYEQRLLEQMEAALAAEDPKLANTLRGAHPRKLHRRRAAIAGVGFLVGLAALIGGMQLAQWIGVIVSVIGFVIMLASTVVALNSWKVVEGQPGDDDFPDPRGVFTDRFDEQRRPTDDF